MRSPFKTIRGAMIACFCGLILVSLLFFYGTSLAYTRERVLANSMDYTSRLIRQLNRDVDSYIEYLRHISELSVENMDVRAYFGESDLERAGERRDRIEAQFAAILDTRPDIAHVALLSKEGGYVINRGQDAPNPHIDFGEVDWYAQALGAEDYVLTASHVQYVLQNNYRWVVTLARPFFLADGSGVGGVFFIDLNYTVLKDLCESNNLGKDSYVYILDDKGQIIYHPKQQLLFRGLMEEQTDRVIEAEEGAFVVGQGDEAKLYTVAVSSISGWRVVGVVSMAELMKGQERAREFYLITAGIMLVAGVLLAVWMSGAITRPLQKIQRSMKEVERGRFQAEDPGGWAGSELESLGRSFEAMKGRISQLMEEKLHEQTQKRKSELRALQSQINPHFLYNTLDSIIWMAEGGKNSEVVQMTAALARLLRQSISNEDEIVPLRREIAYVKGYLSIQKMRYKDKMEYVLDVDPELLDVGVAHLLLQPLVENAIYHGIRHMEGQGLIQIRGRRDGGDLLLQVIDNGLGMSPEAIEAIFERSKESEEERRHGVGAYNVHMRLQLYFGEAYGLRFESRPGEGTVVSARIPLGQ